MLRYVHGEQQTADRLDLPDIETLLVNLCFTKQQNISKKEANLLCSAKSAGKSLSSLVLPRKSFQFGPLPCDSIKCFLNCNGIHFNLIF